MIGIWVALSVITLSVNGFNSPIKMQAGWLY